MAIPVRKSGIATLDSDGKLRYHLVNMPPGSSEGDLIAGFFTARQPQAILTVPAGWHIAAQARGSGSDPAIFAVWRRITVVGTATFTTNVGTYAAWRLGLWDGDTVDWSDPVRGAAAHMGESVAPNPPETPFPLTWTQPQAAGAHFNGYAAMAFRATQTQDPHASAYTGWTRDQGGTLGGPADASGIRIWSGFSHLTEDGGGGYSWAFGNGLLSDPTRASAASLLVQGMHAARPPLTGNHFDYVQLASTTEVQFTDRTIENPEEWLWDFGDSATSESQHPSHVYVTPSTYTVTLKAGNAVNPIDGAGDYTTSRSVTVAPPPPTARWAYANAPGSYRVQFFDASILAETWTWAIDVDGLDGGPYAYTTQNPEHVFSGPGDYLCRLTVTNVAGSGSLDRVVEVVLGEVPPVRPDGLTVAVYLELQGQWVPITCDVMEADWLWGTDDDLGVLSVPGASRLIVRVYDPGRDLDPDNVASPYSGLFDIGVGLRVQLGTGDFMGTVWRGVVGDLVHDLTFCTITGEDLVSRAANFDVDIGGTLVFPQQSAGSRLTALLGAIAYPPSMYSIEPGGTVLQAVEIEQQSIWDAMLEVQKNDLGRLVITQDGFLGYVGRSNAWEPGEPDFIVGCELPGDPFIDVPAIINGTFDTDIFSWDSVPPAAGAFFSAAFEPTAFHA